MYFKSIHRSIFWKPYATYSHAYDRTHIWGVIQNTNVGVAHFICAYVHSLFPNSVSEMLHYTYTIFRFSIWLPWLKCIKFMINLFKKIWNYNFFIGRIKVVAFIRKWCQSRTKSSRLFNLSVYELGTTGLEHCKAAQAYPLSSPLCFISFPWCSQPMNSRKMQFICKLIAFTFLNWQKNGPSSYQD